MQFKKYMARIPIIPDDFENQNVHKNHELVMDFTQDDLYVKKDDGYVNITGKIKEDIKQIADGSAVIHLVTEKTLPQIEDRRENHWYYVITRSGNKESGEQVSVNNYIYYGLIDEYNTSKNYLLIGQNMTDGEDTIQFDIVEGYSPCLYIPIIYNATFINHETEEFIDFFIKDRVYALDTFSGTYNSYDVYVLDLTDPGQYLVDIQLTGVNSFFIYFDVNVSGIQGLVLPETMTVENNQSIGYIPDPSDEDPRYDFVGWSLSKYDQSMIIDTQSYIPEENMTLYAWYNFNENVDDIPYYGDQTSEYYTINFSDQQNQDFDGATIVVDWVPDSLTINPGDSIGDIISIIPDFHVENIGDTNIVFVGWCTDPTDSQTLINTDYIPVDDVILYTFFKYASSLILFAANINQVNQDYYIRIEQTPGSIEVQHGEQIGTLSEPNWSVIDENGNITTTHNIVFVGWCTDLNDSENTMVSETYVPSQDFVELYAVFAEENNITITIDLNQEMDQDYLEWLQIEFDSEFPMTITVPQGTTIRDIIQNNIHYHTTNDDTGLIYFRQLSTNSEWSGLQWWVSYDYVPTENMTLYVVMDYDIA